MRRLLLLILLFSLVLSPLVLAEEDEFCLVDESCDNDTDVGNSGGFREEGDGDICIAVFYSSRCQSCDIIDPIIEEISEKYIDKLHLMWFDLYNNNENYKNLTEICTIRSIPLYELHLPIVIMPDIYLSGEAVEDNLEIEIQRHINENITGCIKDELVCKEGEIIIGEGGETLIFGLGELTALPMVLTAGLIDGINPCAFAVLIFLLTYLLEVSGTKKRVKRIGFVYILAVYISYFLAGLGIFSFIQISGISGSIFTIAAILALVVGLINVKDFFWYGKGFTLKIPESKKETIHKWIMKASVPSAFILGFLVSMFELPCTGGVYLAILSMFATTMTYSTAVFYLLIYNLMFVLPLIVIFVLVYYGMDVEKMKAWKEKKKNWMKLLMGIFLILLGVAMLLGWF